MKRGRPSTSTPYPPPTSPPSPSAPPHHAKNVERVRVSATSHQQEPATAAGASQPDEQLDRSYCPEVSMDSWTPRQHLHFQKVLANAAHTAAMMLVAEASKELSSATARLEQLKSLRRPAPAAVAPPLPQQPQPQPGPQQPHLMQDQPQQEEPSFAAFLDVSIGNDASDASHQPTVQAPSTSLCEELLGAQTSQGAILSQANIRVSPAVIQSNPPCPPLSQQPGTDVLPWQLQDLAPSQDLQDQDLDLLAAVDLDLLAAADLDLLAAADLDLLADVLDLGKGCGGDAFGYKDACGGATPRLFVC